MTFTLTEPVMSAAGLAPPAPDPRPATPDWRRPAPLALGVLAFVLCVAWTNRVFLWAGTPRSAVLLVVLGPGVVALGVLLARRDRVAVAASAFLLVAALSTAFAREPLMALFGGYFAPKGLLFLIACFGLWGLGRIAPPPSARVVAVAILAGATANAAVAWLQMSTDLGIQGLAPSGGRAIGLLGNPVYLSGLCAGAVWIALEWARRTFRPLVPLLLFAFLVGAVQLSGGRSGLLAVLAGSAWFVVVELRARRWWRAGGVAAALVFGILLALVPAGSSSSAVGRVNGDGSGGIAPRVAVWDAGIRSLSEDLVLGAGPGRFVEASSPRRSLVSIRYEGPDILLGDAHNIFVEILATTGVLGFLAFAIWLFLAGRRSRGVLAGFAALVGVTLMLEPTDLAVTPLVFLALGVATLPGTVPRPSLRLHRWPVVLGAVLALVGLVVGVRIFVGDMAYADAASHHSLADVHRAERLSPPWPQYPGLRAALLAEAAADRHDRRLGRAAIRAGKAAIGRDPSDPRWWWSLGLSEEQWGTVAAARHAYHEALQRNPWSYSALAHLYGLELRAGHDRAASEARDRLCEIGPAECPPTPAAMHRLQRAAANKREAR